MSIVNDPRALLKRLAAYHEATWGRSIAETLMTVAPLGGLWLAAAYGVTNGRWWGMAVTPLAAAFLVRLFLIQHDCGHGSFFPDERANRWVGRVAGVITMTPFAYWRRAHAIHHATSGNLDRRSTGGVDTLTVKEYHALSRVRRLAYRMYRHPLIMFGLGPAYLFLLQHRLPFGLMREREAWFSVMATNVALLVGLGLLLGLAPTAVLLMHLTVVVIAGSIGVWLFYVQHQFEGGWWARGEAWTPHEAFLKGSSHLVLPPALRWLTANIGAHHVHHMSSRIPSYRLPQALDDHPELQQISRITLCDSARALRLALWDEEGGRLVSFRQAAANV